MSDDDRLHRLTLAQAAARLRLPRLRAWLWWRSGRFALPADTAEGRPYWHEDELYRWAAATGERKLVRLSPLRYWPTAEKPAEYWGARQLGDCVAQLWESNAGVVSVVWTPPDRRSPSADHLARRLPDADTLVTVQFDFGRDGPGLRTSEPGVAPQWRDFGAKWRDLSRVLGQPAPYWPHNLRVPKLIEQWRPGDSTVVYPTIPGVDTTPLLRLAATLHPDSPAHQVLMNLVAITQRRSTDFAELDLDILDECLQRVGDDVGSAQSTVVAARPLPVPPVDEDSLNDVTARAGWLEILGRTDLLAAECVRVASLWDGGRWFPYSSLEEIDPTTEHGAEWAAQLEPAERTALYERIDEGEPLIDPETGAPVVRKSDGKLLVAVPQRLPTTSPLAEVVLDTPIWIRTQDGTLYPAPRDHYWGLSWGYGGSGPGSLALLIYRLLDDITAPGADHAAGAPDGLDELTELSWPTGTVLPRELLEAARDGKPYQKPVK